MSWRTDLFYHFMRYCWVYPVGCTWFRISATGTEHIPRKGPFILAPNHETHLDPWFVGRFVGTPVNWMATRLWYDGSWWRYRFGKICGTILVDLDRLDLSSAKEALGVLERGGVLGIFPEGERSRDGSLGEGLPGVAYLAARAAVPVVPAAIAGGHECYPRGARFPRPGRIRIRFGPPMEVPPEMVRTKRKDDLRAITDDLMGRIAGLLEDLKREDS